MSEIKVNIGELCTHCFEDTRLLASSPESKENLDNGKWINRIPSKSDAEITHGNTENTISISIIGYMCYTCRLQECDKCHKLVLETEHYDDDCEVLVLCWLCYEEKKLKEKTEII